MKISSWTNCWMQNIALSLNSLTLPARRRSQRRTKKGQSDAARVKTAMRTAATQINQVGGGASKRAAPKRSRVNQGEDEMAAAVPKSRGCPEAGAREAVEAPMCV